MHAGLGSVGVCCRQCVTTQATAPILSGSSCIWASMLEGAVLFEEGVAVPCLTLLKLLQVLCEAWHVAVSLTRL